MGDRANIRVVSEGENDVYFYTHWYGSELKQILARALQRGQDRWGDSQYLNRIIFCEMIKDNVMGETGFGISGALHDNERPLITVDHDDETVTIGKDTWSFLPFIETFHGPIDFD